MSDALTEISRDEERQERFGRLRNLKEVFKHYPTQENREKVIEAAHAVDEVRGGYSYSKRYRTNYGSTIEAELDAIVQGP